MSFAVHGSESKFNLIQLKLELLLNSIKNNNSRYSERASDVLLLPEDEFSGKPVYYKNFFKTPLAVNMCCESMLGPTIHNIEDYGAMIVLQELLTFSFYL